MAAVSELGMSKESSSSQSEPLLGESPGLSWAVLRTSRSIISVSMSAFFTVSPMTGNGVQAQITQWSKYRPLLISILSYMYPGTRPDPTLPLLIYLAEYPSLPF